MTTVNEVTKKQSFDVDGFSGGYSEPPRGGDGGDGGSSGFPGAVKIKFDIHGIKWVDPNGNEIRNPLVAHNVINRVQEWDNSGSGPLSTRTLAPGEPWPDIAAMNEPRKCNDEACKGVNKTCQGNGTCKGEWFEKFGRMVGPFAGEHVVLFVDPDNMVRYWWPSPTATIGACICIRALMEQTTLMRKFNPGLPVNALVELTHAHMNTQYGGRERPHMVIKGFGVFGDGGFKLLPKPTLKQITDDSIPY